MTPSKLALQEAIESRLSSALSTEVGTDPGIPGVEIGDDDETEIRKTTGSTHTDLAHTIRVRSRSEVSAKKTGQDAVGELTDRTNRLNPPSPFHVLEAELTGSDMQRARRVDGPDYYEEIIIITYRITRS
jgi:hypothetical protein